MRLAGKQRHQWRLEQGAHLMHFAQGRLLHGEVELPVVRRGLDRRSEHLGAGTGTAAEVDQSFRFDHAQGFPQRGSGNAEFLQPRHLGRKLVTRSQLTAGNSRPKGVGDQV